MSIRITWAYGSDGGPPAACELESDSIEASLQSAAQRALRHGSATGLVVDFILVDDDALTELHARFLDDSSPTDVIAFDLRSPDLDLEGDAGPEAEIYISLDCALRVSKEREVSFLRELSLYAVHGVLHLCGWDDHSSLDRDAMRAAERVVLHDLGFDEDLLPHEGS